MSQTETTTLTRSIDGVELPRPGTYQLDASHTNVGFVVRHLMVSKVRGSFRQVSGTVVIGEDPSQSSVEVEVDLESIDTRDPKRDEHLRSADFFDTEANKTMTFRSTSVRQADGDFWLVTGDLTIAGVTKSVELAVEFEGAALSPWGSVSIGFHASGKLNREDFGITYTAALETGGVMIGKDVTIDIDAEAVEQA